MKSMSFIAKEEIPNLQRESIKLHHDSYNEQLQFCNPKKRITYEEKKKNSSRQKWS